MVRYVQSHEIVKTMLVSTLRKTGFEMGLRICYGDCVPPIFISTRNVDEAHPCMLGDFISWPGEWSEKSGVE